MNDVLREDSVERLWLSARTTNALKLAGIHTIGQMLDYPETSFLALKNMGKKSVEELLQTKTELLSGRSMFFHLVDTEKSELSPPLLKTASKRATFFDGEGIARVDIPLEELGLSARALGVLKRGGFCTASELIGITEEELRSHRNLGTKSVTEILNCVSRLRFQALEEVSAAEQAAISVLKPADSAALVQELSSFYGGSAAAWKKLVLATAKAFPEANSDRIVYELYQQKEPMDALCAYLLRKTETQSEPVDRAWLLAQAPPHLLNTTFAEEALNRLEAEGRISQQEESVARLFPSALEYADAITDERERFVLQQRLAGKTQEEIGTVLGGLSRERIRQIEEKTLRRRPRLAEDKYFDLFDRYYFSPEDFKLSFEEPDSVYYYLELVTRKQKKKNSKLADALTDETLPTDVRRKIEHAVYKNYTILEGERVEKSRPALVHWVVRHLCREITTIDEFIERYRQMLQQNSFSQEKYGISEARSWENRLQGGNDVLWGLRHRFRAYEIDGRDWNAFVTELNLAQYEGQEISTLLLFRKHPELMQEYDLRDHYELHNLLRKLAKQLPAGLRFGKMPFLSVGEASREEQMLELLVQCAPISAEELGRRYEETYGAESTFISGMYLSRLGEYYHNGMFTIDAAAMPPERMERMAQLLDEDFYTIGEVKKLFHETFPSASPEEINPYNLKLLGFRVYSTYLVKNSCSSANEYFHHLLAASDVLDLERLKPGMLSLTAFTGELYAMKANRTLIEFAPNQYIHLRRLEAGGVTAKELEAYCTDVRAFLPEGTFFTVRSLRLSGFTHPLDELGFDDWFYASILIEDRVHFSYRRVGATKLLYTGRRNVVFPDLVEELILSRGRMDLADLEDTLQETYGIALPKAKLIQAAKDVGLYYNEIMDAVYDSYDTYLEEI